MSTKRSIHHNEPITQRPVMLSDRAIPILLPWKKPGRFAGRIFYPGSGPKKGATLDMPVTRHVPDLSKVPMEYRDRLNYLIRMNTAIEANSKERVKELIQYGVEKGFHTWGTLFNPYKLFGATLNVGLHGIMYVVWWSEKEQRLLPGLFCPDAKTAWYATALSGLGEKGSWAGCLHCGVIFPRKRKDHHYHSPQCQGAAAMRRYRAKQHSVT